MAKVLLISPPFLKNYARNVRWPAVTKGRILRPPDWLASATAVLGVAGYDVRLIDMIADNQSKEDLKLLIIKEQPDWVVLDTSTPSFESDLECAKIVKRYSYAKVIMVGTHVSTFPENVVMQANGAVDYVCKGEYDYTLREIINGNIKSRVVSLPLIEDLDKLPFPAWNFIDPFDYFDGGRMYPYIDVVTGRGCPNQCSFCCWPQTMFGHKYRFRSIKRVVDEIQYDLLLFPLLRYGEFFIEDDTFTVNYERVFHFCDELALRELKINWSANVRADIFNLALLRAMKKSGCRSLSVGFESGNQQILDNVHKYLNLEQGRAFMDLTKQAGLDVHACFVIGLPGETESTIKDTFKFAKEINPATIQFSIATPLPGTEFYNWCKENGYLKHKFEGENSAVMEYPGLTAERMNYYSAKGMKDFYLRPQFIAKYLLTSKSLADFYRRIRGGWNYLEYLL